MKEFSETLRQTGVSYLNVRLKMRSSISSELAIMWNGRGGSNVDSDIELVLEAFERLESKITKESLPEVIEYAKRADVGFWIRELLMQPIVETGGATYLISAFEALKQNEAEGHDSDSLVGYLIDFAATNPAETKLVLEQIRSDSESPFHEDADWLLEHCE